MLDEFMKNNNDIKNIGIIGPYSSGKSSLINSYLNNNKKIKKKTKIISLGNYIEKDQKDLEVIIVQQLLLSKQHEKIGLKILKYAKIIILFLSLFIIIFF